MSLGNVGQPNERALSEALLGPKTADFGRDARRFAAGLSLASLFGLAIGVRFDVMSMAAHAVGVPLAIVAIAVFCTPAFFVGVLHGGLEMDARTLLSTVASGAATAGLVLAGLAPAMGLFSLSAESVTSVRLLVAFGLCVAGLLGHRAMFHAVADELGAFRVRFLLLKLGFGVFAALLAGRVWWLALPIFGSTW